MKRLLPRLLLLLSILLPLAGCERPEEVVPPSNLVPKPQMIQLLVKIHLAEAQVEAAALPTDSARARYNQLHHALLWQAEIPDSIFRRSYTYYATHNNDLDEIYEAVIDSLTIREERLPQK